MAVAVTRGLGTAAAVTVIVARTGVRVVVGPAGLAVGAGALGTGLEAEPGSGKARRTNPAITSIRRFRIVISLDLSRLGAFGHGCLAPHPGGTNCQSPVAGRQARADAPQ